MALRTPVGGLDDAFLIVNSLRYSTFQHDPAAHHIPAVRAFQDVAVNFKNPVSPRLSSHALLHGLIRMGRKQQAADLAVSMMEAGMKLRTKTLETFMHTLTPPPSAKRRASIPPLTFTPNPRSLADIVAMAHHPGSRLALQIFAVARKTHQNNTRGMFGTLLAICLINTEIILASLIFAFAVKEWQRHPALVGLGHESDSVDVPPSRPEPLPATHEMLKKLVRPIKRIFETNVKDPEALGTSLQALANLAVLLDNRQLPFSPLSPLLRVLYHCPRVDTEVWIVDANGKTKQVNAYRYIHDVLERLITSLPNGRGPSRSSSSSSSMLDRRPVMPPLDLHAYNTLLHYALRHRLSPALADTIMKHMVEERTAPLEPDNTTYNILLRSGTLSRDSELAQAAISGLESLSSINNDPSSTNNTAAVVDTDEFQDRAITGLIKALRAQDLTQPTARAEITELLYSLTTHLMHYTSTGRPALAAQRLFELFPELALPLTPSSCSPADVARHKKARRAMVVRASWYGPTVFAVLLNALAKSGRTGLAKALWGMARRAERRSWEGLNPWVLGVEAYTAMMRCWAVEYRRGCSREVKGLERGRGKEKMQMQALAGGMRCYRAMKDVGEEVRGVLRDMEREYRMERVGALPDVDARFVNAALSLFGPTARGPTPSEEEVRREFEETKVRVAETGVPAKGWTPVLQEIAEDVVRVGMEMPPGLRHIFLGRWEEGARRRECPPHVGQIPYAYSGEAEEEWRPFAAPLVRTKGLPYARRGRCTRRSTTIGSM
ncbi:hypothetical protein D9615_008084 [Tricholomella constricta]|uniref:Pentatricopeptide repeat-containing protein n=1 Tax=Tricholomella constricta TaxID=117010 RepID=A0A8H5LVZ4_9AGAR|nr:hypothetical protein D9615_008084 [Tricholomella constricta]